MPEIAFDINNVKLSRSLPQFWSGKNLGFSGKPVNAVVELSRYSEKLFYSLLCIRHYYKEFFNNNNTTTIDEYLRLFNSAFSQIYDELVDKKSNVVRVNRMLNAGPLWLTKGRFSVMQTLEAFNRDSFVYNNKTPIGFTDEMFKKIKPLAKQLFMIEKFCSFTTRKIWNREITKPENFDPKKDFNAIVRVILPTNWKSEKPNKDFEEKRVYFSASLINKKNRNKVFLNRFCNEMAILLLEYDDKKYVCADAQDNFSEEQIEGFSTSKLQTEYTDVFAVSEDVVDGKKHRIFANAVETATPMSIFRMLDQSMYSEINMKNPKVFGVVAPNEESIEFAKKIAKQFNVKMIPPQDFNY